MQIFSKYFTLLVLVLFLSPKASGDLVYSKNGIVVSASELASKVGVQILQKGGNAIDAAVATGFALAVTYPSAGNIAGGGFMVIHTANVNTAIDFREVAPQAATRDMFLDDKGNYDPYKSLKSWLSVGVPGTVAGLIYALEKYGTMSLEEVITPAIKLAENGFELDYWLTNSINYYNKEFSEIPSSRKLFTNEGDSLKIGDLFIQSDLANTLKLIKEYGMAGFYKGRIAELIVEQSLANDGIISLEDLANYNPAEREPIISNYKGFSILGMPPPSAGGIGIAQTLSVFEMFNLTKDKWASSDYIHTLTEILKYVYADRAKHLGDSEFHEVPFDDLLSKEHIDEIYSNVNYNATPSLNIYDVNNFSKESTETTHYSVVDKWGNAVSTTYTLNSAYGNKIVVEGGGFLLNNEMDDFTSKVGVKNQFGLVGSEANAIEPNKRMLSSMSPTIVLKDNQPILIVGSPGGSQIITSTLQVILNVIEFDMDIQEAINAPRFHHQWLPDTIFYEELGIPEDVRKKLVGRGHHLTKIDVIGRVQGIFIDQNKNIIWGTSDKRGYGKAIGY